MEKTLKPAINAYMVFLHYVSCLSPAMMLVVRLWIAHVFFAAGLVKISDFSNTIYLFTNEYHVPLLPPVAAAVLATTFELSCPVLLTLGLMARLAALPLLVMTIIINFTYENLTEHYYWSILLGMIFFYGPGKLSLDYLAGKLYERKASI
ncbi:MAG TPA: DoxX family protein [Rickettsiales bacterium]|nr:DoxX family protein [Rickettsiales bacterium]